MKMCPRCEQTLAWEEFYQVKNRKDGHASWCKQCSNEARKKHKKSLKRPEYKIIAEVVLKEGKPTTCPTCHSADVPSHKMRGRMENGAIRWDCVKCRTSALSADKHVTIFCDWCCEGFSVPPHMKNKRFCGEACLAAWRRAVRLRAKNAAKREAYVVDDHQVPVEAVVFHKPEDAECQHV